MKKKIIKKLIKRIYYTNVILLFAATSFLYASDILNTKSEYLGSLTNELATVKPKSMKDLIFQYCNGVVNAGKMQTQEFIYSAKDSLFVYLLCKNVGYKVDDFVFAHNDYEDVLKIDTFNRLEIPCFGSMNTCNIAKHIPNMFDEIINEYTNIKQSTIYGLLTPDFSSEDIDTQANVFGENVFMGVKLCDKNGDGCKYPQTFNHVTNYIKLAKELIKRLNIIDAKKLSAYVNNKYDPKKSQGCNIVIPEDKSKYEYEIMACGLYGGRASPMQSFMYLVYNELFYYRLFGSYYTSVVGSTLEINSATTSSIKNSIGLQQKRLLEMNKSLARSQKAVSVTVRGMREISMTYPLHIGLLMYHEDLYSFRASLVKVVTPIYTLYDKLRNVQKME